MCIFLDFKLCESNRKEKSAKHKSIEKLIHQHSDPFSRHAHGGLAARILTEGESQESKQSIGVPLGYAQEEKQENTDSDLELI